MVCETTACEGAFGVPCVLRPRAECGADELGVGRVRVHASDIAQFRCVLRRRFVRTSDPRALSPQDVDDAIQEAFARVLLALRSGRNHEATRQPTAYLFSTARNLCISRLRCLRREQKLLAPALLETRATPFSLDDDGEEERALEQRATKYVAALPPELAALFQARFVLGFSQRLSAQHLGVTRRRARTLERRLICGLARHLELKERHLRQLGLPGRAASMRNISKPEL